MHTYRIDDDDVFTVGHYEPRMDSEGNLTYQWYPLTDFTKEIDAIMRVNLLNGGRYGLNAFA